MITCLCPKCNSTFRHENAEAIFCPRCETELCEIVDRDDEASPPYNTNTIPIPTSLIVATLVVMANAFAVSLLCIFTWASLGDQSGRGLLMLTNGAFFSIPAIFCFIKYREYRGVLIPAAMFGCFACFGLIYLGPLLMGR